MSLTYASGVEASRACTRCGETFALSGFHKHPKGPLGLHSWCKRCANAGQKASRLKNGRPPQKRKWLLYTRYRLTPADVDAMMLAQDGCCAICGAALKRPVIDHCHDTGKVRGLLCCGCNVKLAGLEREDWRVKATAYLQRSRP